MDQLLGLPLGQEQKDTLYLVISFGSDPRVSVYEAEQWHNEHQTRCYSLGKFEKSQPVQVLADQVGMNTQIPTAEVIPTESQWLKLCKPLFAFPPSLAWKPAVEEEEATA